MLQSIRDHAQGWIAWVIVGLIILTFALFGIDQYARGDKAVVVAEVNGQNIGGNAFVSLYNRQKERLQVQFGEMYDQVVKDDELRMQVLDALIESEVMRQWANDNNMIISDQQLAAAIHSADAFKKDGEFSEEIYEEVLMRNGLNIARFEYEQRQYLLESQFRALSMAASFVTQAEIDQLAALQAQQRNVSYLRIDQRPFLKTVEITEQAIQKVYESNLDEYLEPEKISVDYIDLSQAQIAKSIEVTDEQLNAYFEDNVALFTLPEKRQAKHILIPLEADTEEGRAAAEAIIAEVQAKIAAGESFSALAKIYSKDPGSATTGGDLGAFEQGMMVPEFDDAVFTMEVGQVSEPVKTDFGYHLIKLTAITGKQVQAFETVKADVLEQYKAQEAERQYYDLLEQLSTIAYEQSDSLEPAADAIGIKVQSSEMFSRDGGPNEILTNGKVLAAAFSEDVLKSHLNSAAIEISANRSIVVRVNQHQPSRQKALAEVSAGIKERLVREAAIKEAAKLAASLMTKVEAGENPESLMTDGVEWNTVGWIARNSQKLLPQMVTEAFKVAKPSEEGKATWRSYQLSTGDTVLISVSGVKTNNLDNANKAPIKEAYNDIFATSQYEARIQALITKADIVKLPVYETVK
ncbi:MAG: peptidyl-prolyl cis-trans isomerase D [Thiomicrorhabdus sp.]|nr:MAG: peptidyl-prolyl cis-trans isomerase D [Thiomicrorhabdus sp.]